MWGLGRRQTQSPRALFLLVLVGVGLALACPPVGSAAQASPPAGESPSGQSPTEKDSVQIPPVPRGMALDGDVGEWGDIPPLFALHKSTPDAPDGMIWLAQATTGIVIAGKIFGAPPQWPPAPDQMALGDHVEVWLADPKGLDIKPPIWGIPAYGEYLNTEEDCNNVPEAQDCKDSFRRQSRIRKLLGRLFVRQWQITPDHAEETYARPAFQALPGHTQKSVQALRPAGTVLAKFKVAESREYAYSFEILIPWDAFPPFHPLRLEETRLLVDVFKPGSGTRRYGPFATTSPTRRYGRVETFSPVRLGQPREYFITPCHIPVPEDEGPYDPGVHFIFPTERLDVRKVLSAHDDILESGEPLAATVEDFYVRNLGEGRLLCGPRAHILHQGKVFYGGSYIKQNAAFKRLPNDDLLIKQGPERYTNSRSHKGQCGACPAVVLEIYHLNRASNSLSDLFEYRELEGGIFETIRIHVRRDWKRIDIREFYPSGQEQITSYCFDPKAPSYVLCAGKPQRHDPTKGSGPELKTSEGKASPKRN